MLETLLFPPPSSFLQALTQAHARFPLSLFILPTGRRAADGGWGGGVRRWTGEVQASNVGVAVRLAFILFPFPLFLLYPLFPCLWVSSCTWALVIDRNMAHHAK